MINENEKYVLVGTSAAMPVPVSPEVAARWKKEREEEEKKRKINIKQRIERLVKKSKTKGQLKKLMFELAEDIREENSEW